VFQSELERNFHVFYQLLSSDDVQLRDLMLVKGIHAYHYLRHSFKNSCFTFEDSEDWKATLHALQVLGVTSDEIQYVALFPGPAPRITPLCVFRCIRYVKEVLAAILHLGNITFAKVEARDSKCVIITDGSPDNASDHEEKKGDESENKIMNRAVSFASQLLACSEEDLRKSLLTRRLLVGGEWIDVPLTLEQAQDNRDALSKVNCTVATSICTLGPHSVDLQELYSRTFDWLVTKINQSTSASCPVTTTTSVLDIFGFEVGISRSTFLVCLGGFPSVCGFVFQHFQFNSFEQLCINYANEHLQQRFTKDVFECAQAEYVAEGVPWDMIAYKDNKELLDLFEGRLGVLSLLNEECMLPKVNDCVSCLLLERFASLTLLFWCTAGE
jgi:myosin V